MPFVQTNMIDEAREIQEILKDDHEAREIFKKYELAHIEEEKLRLEVLELRNQLVGIRKSKNITQKEIKEKTGLTQQAISRLEVGKDVTPSLISLLKYCEAIGCRLIPQVLKK